MDLAALQVVEADLGMAGFVVGYGKRKPRHYVAADGRAD
jgi:hypothetical protein